MCKFISFWHEPKTGDLAMSDLMSHSGTYSTLKLDNRWREGHYTPDGTVELRFNPDDHIPEDYVGKFKERFPTFKEFFKHCLVRCTVNGKFGGSLDVSGCDLKGVKLPESIGGSLYVRGCDLKGVKLPKSIGGSLDVSGCDLKGVKLPENVKVYK